MSQSTSNLRTLPTKQPRWFKILLGLIAVFVALIFLLLISGTNCIWTGEQISMDGFRRRHFSAQRIPGIGTQLGETAYYATTGELEDFLVKKQWISPRKISTKSDEWITVYDQKGGSHWSGDAQLLVSYLEMTDHQGTNMLKAWSEANPDLAVLLWPEIEQAGRVDHFFLIPDMIYQMQEFEKRNPKPTSSNTQQQQAFLKKRHAQAQTFWYPHLGLIYTNLADSYDASNQPDKAKQMKREAIRTQKMQTPLKKPPTFLPKAKK